MPSTEAPTFYERSRDALPSTFDPFLRHLQADWFTEETGDVESPLGFVALFCVDLELIQGMYADISSGVLDEMSIPSAGWYILRQDSNGIVWGLDYGGSGTFSEEAARADFAEAEATYAAWSEANSDDI